jgi:4-diphosphocytidyl-2C-methyl-D-erythritol kinase
LRTAGAPQAVLTGSGSTVYALFARADDARRAYTRLTAAGHQAILTATVSAATQPYYSASSAVSNSSSSGRLPA